MALRELMDYVMISNATVQITRLTAPAPSCGKSRRPSVVDVGLVNPEGVAQYKPVLVAGYRGERAAPPLEVHLVADATQLGRALDGDDGAHESNESDPDREHLLAVLKDGARERGEPPAAAARLVDDFSVQQELVGGEARHERPEGVCLSHMDLSHPPERPPGGIVAKQRSGRALGQIPCLARKDITFGGLAVPDSSPVI